MPTPAYLTAVRESYDTVAAEYARRYTSELLDTLPLSRAMLRAFVEHVDGPVLDAGCGPGHVTQHLHTLGAQVSGVDLSPAMIALAREAFPHLTFEVGSIAALPHPDGSMGGILAWYSTHHTPPAHLPRLYAELRRVLAPGGYLLLGTHLGDEHIRATQGYGLQISYESHLIPVERITELLAAAGVEVVARLIEEPGVRQKRPQLALLGRAQ